MPYAAQKRYLSTKLHGQLLVMSLPTKIINPPNIKFLISLPILVGVYFSFQFSSNDMIQTCTDCHIQFLECIFTLLCEVLSPSFDL